jgi:hypothetical protein
MATDSIFSRAVRRFCSWVVRRGGDDRPPTVVITPLITQPDQQRGAPIPVFDLTSYVVDDDTIVRSDGSSGDTLHAARYDHPLWRIGWSDGRLGVNPESQNELIKAQAALTRQTRIAGVEAELAKARATEKFRETDYRGTESDWIATKKEHDTVSAQQRRDPAEFSRLLGSIYFFSALAILIADMPLSLVVAQTLGIQVAIGSGNPMDLMNLYDNFSSSWEALAVALGVTALTISFKLVIDRLYVRDDDGESLWTRRIRVVLRLTALVMAAAGTTSAFLVMGRVRAVALALPGSPGAIPNPTDDRYLFSVLAILFPLIAGFCLSLSRLCWQNARRLELAAKAVRIAWQRYKVAQQPYEVALSERAAVDERLKAMKDGHTDEMFLRELYTHAFDRGWAVPETRMPGASLYERCAHLMHRALARIEQLDNA